MFARLMRLWRPQTVAFTTPTVGRFFLGCRRCGRVVPQYRCYGSQDEPGAGRCRCGHYEFSPIRIAEWRAAAWVLTCLVWRKWVRKCDMWDPRIAMRVMGRRES